MPRIDIEQLSDDARIWIFGISPALDETKSAQFLHEIDHFLASWAAHGTPIVAARELLHGSFLVIAVDKRSETSGCSIDKMFGLLRQLEQKHGVEVLEGTRVFARDDAGNVRGFKRADFRAIASGNTPVFDHLVERLGEVRSGRWEKPAAESWHRSLLSA
ncbi:MAG TPA: hypothetical protein VF698_08920 [Thermoanaerobaculia bacterium]